MLTSLKLQCMFNVPVSYSTVLLMEYCRLLNVIPCGLGVLIYELVLITKSS
jgi:hypothetical protein